MNSVNILGINVYPYLSFEDLINDAVAKKKMLLSVNAEILLKSDDELKTIYNNKIMITVFYINLCSIRSNIGSSSTAQKSS